MDVGAGGGVFYHLAWGCTLLEDGEITVFSQHSSVPTLTQKGFYLG